MGGPGLRAQGLMPGNRFKAGQRFIRVYPGVILKRFELLKQIPDDLFAAKSAAGLADKTSPVQNFGDFIAA